MSVRRVVILTCDKCGITAPGIESAYGTVGQVRLRAQSHGWHFGWKANRTRADICSACIALERK